MSTEENPILKEVVEQDSPLKTLVVNYVGTVHSPENGEITVEMIVDTMVKEFPEFLMVIAEENWIRGYHQALGDVEEGERLAQEQSTTPEQTETTEEVPAAAE